MSIRTWRAQGSSREDTTAGDRRGKEGIPDHRVALLIHEAAQDFIGRTVDTINDPGANDPEFTDWVPKANVECARKHCKGRPNDPLPKRSTEFRAEKQDGASMVTLTT